MRLLALLVCLLWSAPAWATTFSVTAYDSCMDGITASDDRLLAASPEEAGTRQQDAIEVRSRCAVEMESWLTDDALPSDYYFPIEGSLTGIMAELSYLLVEQGQCLQARGWLKKYKQSPRFNEASSDFQKLKATVDKCGGPEPEAKAAPAPAAQVTTPIIVNTTAAPLPAAPRSRSLRNWGYALLGVGVASGIGGLLYNSAGAEDRDEYDGLSTVCDTTPTCDVERVNTLAGNIDDAKMPLAAMYGLAGVAALTGATFVTLDLIDGSDDRSARLLLSPNAIQVAVRW